MNVFYWVFIAIALVLWYYRIRSYYRFKTSGASLFIGSFRTLPLAILWISIGVLSVPKAYFQFTRGVNFGGSWFEEILFWILMSSLLAITSLQPTKINQDGVLEKGYLWQWGEILSWEWDNNDKSTMVLKVKPKIKLFQTSATIKLRTKVEEKDSLEQLFSKYCPLTTEH